MAEQRNEARNGRNGTGGTLIPWAAFIIGAGTSVAANVAHAAERAEQAGMGGMLFAAWAPIALLLVAEMITRGRKRSGGMAFVQWSGAALVALAAAVVSFGHMRGLLLSYGESELVAVLLPLSVDGLVLVASVALSGGTERAEPAPAERNEAAERNEVAEPAPAERNEAAARRVPSDSVPAVGRNADPEPAVVPDSVPVPAAARTERDADPEPAARRVPSVTDASSIKKAAVAWVRNEWAEGREPSGASVGRQFRRTDRWGRNVLAAAREAEGTS